MKSPASINGRIGLNAVEVEVVIFRHQLLHHTELQFGYLHLRAFPYQQNQVLQEVDLLDVQLPLADVEGVHGDGLVLRIGDVLAAHILAESLIRVTRIDHDDVGVLLPQLAHHAVHVEFI